MVKKIEKHLITKVQTGKSLTKKEQMQLIILPLIFPEKKEQLEAVERAVNLEKIIKSDEIMKFVLTGILVFTDKIIEDEMSQKIRRWIMMTKVERIFEKEKEEAVNKVLLEKKQIEVEKERIELENIRIQKENSKIQEENSKIQEENSKIQEENSKIQIENNKIQIENKKMQHEKDQSILNGIRGIMEALKINAQAAMDYMKLSPQDREKYSAML